MPDEFTHDVLLSHSGKDKAVVRAATERLRANGLPLWFSLRRDDAPARGSEGRLDSRIGDSEIPANQFLPQR